VPGQFVHVVLDRLLYGIEAGYLAVDECAEIPIPAAGYFVYCGLWDAAGEVGLDVVFVEFGVGCSGDCI
jgi:hypothetical protein